MRSLCSREDRVFNTLLCVWLCIKTPSTNSKDENHEKWQFKTLDCESEEMWVWIGRSLKEMGESSFKIAIKGEVLIKM